jgi:hypothetical protein
MAKYTPQYNLFIIIKRIAFINQILFWAILIFSIVPVTFKEFCETTDLVNIINILNVIGISMFFILKSVNNFVLVSQADSKRRDDFIDNSFGSGFSTKNSIEYFDNDEIEKGLYKASVNLFENCFFTYSLVKSITIKKIVIPALIFISILVLAYYGFKSVPISLTVLQALFSANILEQLIKHLVLLTRLTTIYESWISLFQQEDLKTNIEKYQTYIYRYWLQYETLHSRIIAGIPEKIYNKLNPSLTQEWSNMKSKYKIR